MLAYLAFSPTFSLSILWSCDMPYPVLSSCIMSSLVKPLYVTSGFFNYVTSSFFLCVHLLSPNPLLRSLFCQSLLNSTPPPTPISHQGWIASSYAVFFVTCLFVCVSHGDKCTVGRTGKWSQRFGEEIKQSCQTPSFSILSGAFPACHLTAKGSNAFDYFPLTNFFLTHPHPLLPKNLWAAWAPCHWTPPSRWRKWRAARFPKRREPVTSENGARS